MKKYLMLAVIVLSFNALAKDVEDMTKEEVKVIHIELYESVKVNTTEAICEKFDRFDLEASQLKKIKLLDFDAQERQFLVKNKCREIGYMFNY